MLYIYYIIVLIKISHDKLVYSSDLVTDVINYFITIDTDFVGDKIFKVR